MAKLNLTEVEKGVYTLKDGSLRPLIKIKSEGSSNTR
jgi:hypothetical protein